MIRMLFVLALAIPSSGYANALEVSPIRIYLDNKNPIGTLYLTNKSHDKVYLQLESKHWEQTFGKDYYSSTNKIIISPPILTISPGESQLVRVALRSKEKFDDEDAYRLYIQEVPHYQNENTGISFNLRVGIPIFIEPNAVSDKKLQWKVTVKNRMLDVSITNISHYHCQLVYLDVRNAKNKAILISQNVFMYLLPKQVKHFIFPLKTRLDEYVNVETKSDWGSLHSQVKV